MTARPISSELPPQLRSLASVTQFLAAPVRDALRAKLASAPPAATPELVLADTFAQLGYLPEEAKAATLKVLAMVPTDPEPSNS